MSIVAITLVINQIIVGKLLLVKILLVNNSNFGRQGGGYWLPPE
jgi:hypothetical protein